MIAMTQRYIDVMHHHHRDDIAFARLFAYQIHHVELIVKIERAQRFIQQQQRRLTDQRLRQPHQLFLSAGKLIEIAQRQVGNAKLLQQRHYLGLAASIAAAARSALRHDDRFQHVQMHTGWQ
ncbi:hypothetical protein D3C71_1715880 [compost metagenome]